MQKMSSTNLELLNILVLTIFLKGEPMPEYSVMSIEYGRELRSFFVRRIGRSGLKARARTEGGAVRVSVSGEEKAVFFRTLAEHIVKDLRPFELARFVGLLPASMRDKRAILPYALELARGGEDGDIEAVSNALFEYYKEEDSVITEGFLRFRLSHLLEKWAMAVDRAGEELLLERELKELFSIIGLVTDHGAPESAGKEAELILYADGSWVLSEEPNCRIEGAESDRSSLLALLMSLSPGKLTVYDLTGGNGAGFRRTLSAVFGDSAIFYIST